MLEHLIHEYLVCRVVADWISITNPESKLGKEVHHAKEQDTDITCFEDRQSKAEAKAVLKIKSRDAQHISAPECL